MQRETNSRDMHYHNLNSSTEGNRALNFMVADLSGVLGDSRTISERLEALLSEPPRGLLKSTLLAVEAELSGFAEPI